jgi:hypothetical protein
VDEGLASLLRFTVDPVLLFNVDPVSVLLDVLRGLLTCEEPDLVPEVLGVLTASFEAPLLLLTVELPADLLAVPSLDRDTADEASVLLVVPAEEVPVALLDPVAFTPVLLELRVEAYNLSPSFLVSGLE